ncbi:MAG: sialidase family protein [Planctomycetota bacterium]|nr:sialidase family protein [Planctomycetota bacterium]MDG1986145.1 sialidase family protein [Planctomycetota bacterium]
MNHGFLAARTCRWARAIWVAALFMGVSSAVPPAVQHDRPLGASASYQGAQASDAFSAIHYIGNDRIIAGKRSSGPNDRFLLSIDNGASWAPVACPGSSGAHTYFFGQNRGTLLAGTGDTGNACIMRSVDKGSSWGVALSAAQLGTLIGSSSPKAIFGTVHLGAGRWLANVKAFDTTIKVIESADDGATWTVPAAQPGQGASAWARQMIQTGDGVLLWPSCNTDQMYRSKDLGQSWKPVTVPGAALFQPLCDAGHGVYLCGGLTTAPNGVIKLHRSHDQGRTWSSVAAVNLQRPTMTYWRDITGVDGVLYASACCVEGTSNERRMRLYRSADYGKKWTSLGNPYIGPFGGMQAIYQMCVTDHGEVFAACQPDSTILRWPLR